MEIHWGEKGTFGIARYRPSSSSATVRDARKESFRPAKFFYVKRFARRGLGKRGLDWHRLSDLFLMNHSKAELFHAEGKSEHGGGLGYLFLWLLGVPVPILLVIFLVRGCT